MIPLKFPQVNEVDALSDAECFTVEELMKSLGVKSCRAIEKQTGISIATILKYRNQERKIYYNKSMDIYFTVTAVEVGKSGVKNG